MKQFTVIVNRNGREPREVTGSIEELTKYFEYTLEKGASWQYEKGNKKIDKHPKTVKSLIKNLNNAESNASANGCPSVWYC